MSIAYVAGATGYTGRAVVQCLTQAGIETHAHIRPDSKSLAEWTDKFTQWGAQVDTTPWDQEAMTKRLKGLNPDAVFGCLGTTSALPCFPERSTSSFSNGSVAVSAAPCGGAGR